MWRILTVVLLLASTAQAQQQITYRIERSYGDVAAAVERVVNEPRHTPFKLPNLPALIEGKDIVLTTTIDPTRRAYVANMEVKKGRLSFIHKVELWGKPDHYVIRATVDIDWCWRARFGSRIVASLVSRAECTVLQMEKCKVLEYARQMETPEVELAQDSLTKILIDAYRLIKRISELRSE